MPRMCCSHVAYFTNLNVQTLTTSRLPKRSWQSEVELNLIIIFRCSNFTTSHLPRHPSCQRWNYVGEKWPMNFAWNAWLPRSIPGSFTCRKSTTWDRRLYFPSEGRRAEDFFALKNPTASAGFEPANLGTKGQHATSRPPKPLTPSFGFSCYFLVMLVSVPDCILEYIILAVFQIHDRSLLQSYNHILSYC